MIVRIGFVQTNWVGHTGKCEMCNVGEIADDGMTNVSFNSMGECVNALALCVLPE